MLSSFCFLPRPLPVFSCGSQNQGGEGRRVGQTDWSSEEEEWSTGEALSGTIRMPEVSIKHSTDTGRYQPAETHSASLLHTRCLGDVISLMTFYRSTGNRRRQEKGGTGRHCRDNSQEAPPPWARDGAAEDGERKLHGHRWPFKTNGGKQGLVFLLCAGSLAFDYD